MNGINKAIIVGTMGQDPEIRYTANGGAVANLIVATSETWHDKQSGSKQEKTEWHKIILFGKLAEIAEQYLRKGRQVYFEGKIQTRKWQDKSGNDRYSVEIVAREMQMLGGKPDSAAQGNAEPSRPMQNNDGPGGGDDFDNSRIPF